MNEGSTKSLTNDFGENVVLVEEIGEADSGRRMVPMVIDKTGSKTRPAHDGSRRERRATRPTRIEASESTRVLMVNAAAYVGSRDLAHHHTPPFPSTPLLPVDDMTMMRRLGSRPAMVL